MRRWLRPGLLPWHLVVAGVVAAFVALGMWQLDRHQSLQARNELLAARLSSARITFAEALRSLDPDAPPGAENGARFRPVVTVGRFLAQHEVLLRGRSLDDQPGFHVLTPLQRVGADGEIVDGPAVLVDRGWIPYRVEDPALPPWAPPTGVVRVEGRLMPEADPPSGPLAALVPRDPPEGPLERIARPDVDRLQPQIPVALAPYLIELERASLVPDGAPTDADAVTTGPDRAAGTDAALPLVPDAPRPEGGPHLAYAAQWFFFALVAAGGYVLLLRGRLAGRAGRRSVSPPSR